jgi:uncharacterized protein (DUF2249 family)
MAEPIVVTLDVRKMVARERHPTIFSRLDALKPGDRLRLVNDHDPTPLRYQLFAERPGMFTWEPEKQGPTEWIISIQKIAGKSEEQVKGEAQAEAGNLIVFDLGTLIHFKDEGPYVQVLSDIGSARMVLFAFKAGQQLKEHSTSSQILVHILRGRITFTTTGNSVEAQAEMVLQLEANVPHSSIAQTDAVMLVIMTPSPSYHSLEREVFQGLTPLVTRTITASEQGV